jgi:ubiquinone/menaquinone biosynthesis C-methylase UbiE
MTSAALFDRVAARYDALWTTTPIGRAQRDLVWRDMDPLFQPGQRILDIGCGTGEDAAHFTSRGVTVHATDASRAMIEIAHARGITAAVCRAEDLVQLGGMFDGAISNFGALNCVEDLPAVARSLAALVRPGGRVAICLLGRFCAWETLYYGARMQWSKAFRRWSGYAPPAYYPKISQVRAAFAPAFELQRWTGIGLCVPPSYVHLPAFVVGCFAACDRLLARLPLLRAIADHRLLLLVRK